MAITTIKRHSPNKQPAKRPASALSTAATVALLFAPCAHAVEWKITPTVGLEEIYTDNLYLTPVGSQQSDFITKISPGLGIKGSGRHLKLKAKYELENLAYAKRGGSIDTQHQFNGDAHAEVIDNLFFLDGKAAVSQQTISPFGPQATSTANLSNNRTNVKTYSLSPSLQHRFGSTASTELRYTHDAVDTGLGGLLDSQSDTITFGLNSGTSFRTVGWGLHHTQRNTDYDNAASLKTEETSVSLRYLLTPRLNLTATGGYEKNNYASLGAKPEGRFWTTGFSWAPTSRTNVVANAGHRFYGKTFSLLANHRTRNTVWNISYNEDITTTQAQFSIPATLDTSAFLNELLRASIPDAQTRQQVVDARMADLNLPSSLSYSVNTLTNRVFLQKSWQASVALNGASNTVLLSVFDMRRDAQTARGVDTALLGAGNLALEDNTRQLGTSALWNWRLSPRTNASISTGFTQSRSLATGLTTDTNTFRASLTRQFQPKLKGTLEYRRLQQEFNQVGRDIRENAVSAALLMTF